MVPFLRQALWLVTATAQLAAATSPNLFRHDHNFRPDYILRVTQAEVSVACRARLNGLINGTSPGPAIYMKENQVTWVRVYNDVEGQNLTMHWHGLSQSVAPFSDGTPQASQWPIKAHHFFDYEIKPKVGEAGSYFYHSHVGFQAADIAGPLIVEEEDGQKPPYTYDHERIMFVSEFYNKSDEVAAWGLENLKENFWSGEAAAILVNGNSYRSIGANASQTPHPWSKPNPAVESTCGPEVFEVEPDKTYRFRAIGGTALSLVTFAIEDHDNLTVIAADAGYTKPAHTDHIQVGPGQRFDFLLRTKSAQQLKQLNKTTFWVQLETKLRPTNVTGYAILHYKTGTSKPIIPATAPKPAPLTLSSYVQYWLEYQLQPLTPNGFPNASQVTRQVVLTSAQQLVLNGNFWTVQNRTWTETNEHLGHYSINNNHSGTGVPYLVNVYRNGEKAIPNYDLALKYNGWDPNLNVYAAKVGEIIDIVLLNQPNGIAGGFDPHPWHIHGDHVWDLGSGPGTYNATANEIKLKGFNPVKRDSTWLYRYTMDDFVGGNKNYTDQGWRAWRLQVNNPGVWMVHCHSLQHMIMGMQTVWVMGNATDIIQDNLPLLTNGYLDFGGNAYGNSSFDPLVNHHFD